MMQRVSIAALVLAAGSASRFGSPKQLARIDGDTLIRRACLTALAAGCAPVLVITGANSESMSREVDDLPLTMVLNSEWSKGIGSSVRAGIRTLVEKETAAAALLMLADQPFITAQHLRLLIDGFRDSQSLVIASEYFDEGRLIQGVPAIFASSLFQELMQLDDKAGAKCVIMRRRADALFIPMPAAAIDIDTQSDLLRVQRSFALRQSPGDLFSEEGKLSSPQSGEMFIDRSVR